MNAKVFTKEMFYQHLRKQWADRGFPLEENGRIGVEIGELVAHSAERNNQQTLPYLDL